MAVLQISVLSVLLGASWAADLRFPAGFKFGAASAAYQVEGAWNVSDKSENIWDRFLHAHPVEDGSNGDVACNSYYLYKEDVRLAAEIGLHNYRFSISWSRLLPTGYPNVVSKDGKDYYNNLINELLRNNIEPVVSIYHWDLPQRLQNLGGWTNPLIAEWFADYADVVFSLFGDRVKTWITINEPIAICDIAYNTAIFAPGILDPDNAAYICNKNLLIAHAKAYRIYDEDYRSLYGGQVSLTNYGVWCEGDTKENKQLAELVNQYEYGRYYHAIFSKEGGWPPAIQEIIATNSKKEGFPRSRLPSFTKEEIRLIKGTADFLALNYYTAAMVRKQKPGEVLHYGINGDVPELGAKLYRLPEWPVSDAFSDFAVYPIGLRNLLKWLKEQYGPQKIMITENGLPTPPGSSLNDVDRIKYLKEHMEQVLLAIKEDEIDVIGYSVWSLMDNFEWSTGYGSKFGLNAVDFNDPERKRTPRKSAAFFANVIRTRNLGASRVDDEL